MDIKILQEFKDLIPPLTGEEYRLLKQSCLKEGIREQLVLAEWIDKETGELVIALADGHNRFDIAEKHNIPFDTKQIEFESKEDVKLWMIDNQKGRRNLSDFVKYELSQIKAEILREKGREKISKVVSLANQINPKKSDNDFSTLSIIDKVENKIKAYDTEVKEVAEKIKKHNTRNEIAKDLGWSTGKLAMADVVAKKADEETKQALRRNEVTIAKVYKEVKQKERKEKKESLVTKGAELDKLSNKIELLEGDLFDMIDMVEDNSIDLLNTDPPYFVLKDDWDTFDSLEDYLKFTEDWLLKVMPKVKSTGRAYISFPQWYEHDIYEIFKRNDFFGFIFKQKIIWYYKNNNQPSNRKEYRYMYEPIFYLYGKDAGVLNFTPDTYGESQQNVWEIAMPQSNFKEGKFHSAQKPIELYNRIIKTGSKAGDKVLDCFAGSGTTGIVCNKLKRVCALIERDEININLIKGRLHENI